MDSNKYRILILKSHFEEDGEDSYIKALAESQVPAILVPTLQFEFKNLQYLRASLCKPENYSGFLFVSPRCVQSVIECFHDETDLGEKEKWKELKCFVVGEATARVVKDELQLSCLGSISGNLVTLLQTIDPSSLDKPLLMPCGNLNKALPEEKYYNIEKVIVYETRQHLELKNRLEELLEDESDCLIVFFSASGVEFAMPYISNMLNPKIQFIALGPTTNKAIEKWGINALAVCDKPNPESLVREIFKIIERR